ncbi:Thiamine-phosphate synthase [Hartmannibacter diazotrophicus]|uniref:Thiamine-phosphate synthase n=1 Tax=Hartmannibacter diazotrophicus TaxID=1482074 RepID=A0A2C9D7W9_9HYPH|nr:thiamine phosphate synthase [Hartmannibacter diazotrophicus]SON56269.1 Thiamine-phosphate synthase [Hartmannibacter diazotrophicus]
MPETLDRFYLVIDRLHWLPRFLPLGLKFVQLRIKDQPDDVVRAEIAEAIRLCKQAGCTLVINDYWQMAIEFGAEWLHLGQEDLEVADVAAIRKAGIKLGISTHSDEELETALSVKPDYVALGPVYETTLKVMPWKPQGLERVAKWRARLDIPLVGIGGITLERAPGVFAAGADSISVVSDVLRNADPDARLKQWLDARGSWTRSELASA